MNSNNMFKFTIKTLDSADHPFEMERDSTVLQLKEKIQAQMGININMQRLIFCGRVLQDDKKLTEYNVEGKVVHLVERAPQSMRCPTRPTAAGSNLAARPMEGASRDGLNPHGPSATARRLDTLKDIIRSIRLCLRHCMQNKDPIANWVQGSTSDEESEGWMSPEPSSSSSDSDSDDSRSRHSRPVDFASLLDELRDLEIEFRPYRDLYMNYLRDASNSGIVLNERSLIHRQGHIDRVRAAYHHFAHAYHIVSDVNLLLAPQDSRLTSDVVFDQAAPSFAQAHLGIMQNRPFPIRTMTSQNRQRIFATQIRNPTQPGNSDQADGSASQTSGQNQATDSNQTSANQAPTPDGSSATDANQAEGTTEAVQPPSDECQATNTTQTPQTQNTNTATNAPPNIHPAGLNIEYDPITVQVQIETRVPFPFEAVMNSLERRVQNRTPGQDPPQNGTTQQSDQENQENRDNQANQGNQTQNAQAGAAMRAPSVEQFRDLLSQVRQDFHLNPEDEFGGFEVMVDMDDLAPGNATGGAAPGAPGPNLPGRQVFAGTLPWANVAGGNPDLANTLFTAHLNGAEAQQQGAQIVERVMSSMIRQGLVPGVTPDAQLMHVYVPIVQNATAGGSANAENEGQRAENQRPATRFNRPWIAARLHDHDDRRIIPLENEQFDRFMVCTSYWGREAVRLRERGARGLNRPGYLSPITPALAQYLDQRLFERLSTEPLPSYRFAIALTLLLRESSLFARPANSHEPDPFRQPIADYIRLIIPHDYTPEDSEELVIGMFERNASFLQRLPNITDVRDNVDLVETVRSVFLRFINQAVGSISQPDPNVFSDRFRLMCPRIFMELCGYISYCCVDGIDGLRRIYRAFIIEVVRRMPESLRDMMYSLNMDNLYIFLDRVSTCRLRHLQNIQMLPERRGNRQVASGDTAESSGEETGPLSEDQLSPEEGQDSRGEARASRAESAAESTVGSATESTAGSTAGSSAGSTPVGAEEGEGSQPTPAEIFERIRGHLRDITDMDISEPETTQGNGEDSREEASPTSDRASATPRPEQRRVRVNERGSPLVSTTDSKHESSDEGHSSRLRRSHPDRSGGSNSDSSSSSSTGSTIVLVQSPQASSRPDPQVSDSSSVDDNFVPPAQIREHWGEAWEPTFRRDRHAAARADPCSDAYMSGMPSKKRRCVRQSRPPANLNGLIEESMNEVNVQATEGDGVDHRIRAIFNVHIRDLTREIANASPDYTGQRFPGIAIVVAGRNSSQNEEMQVDNNVFTIPPSDMNAPLPNDMPKPPTDRAGLSDGK